MTKIDKSHLNRSKVLQKIFYLQKIYNIYLLYICAPTCIFLR